MALTADDRKTKAAFDMNIDVADAGWQSTYVSSLKKFTPGFEEVDRAAGIDMPGAVSPAEKAKMGVKKQPSPFYVDEALLPKRKPVTSKPASGMIAALYDAKKTTREKDEELRVKNSAVARSAAVFQVFSAILSSFLTLFTARRPWRQGLQHCRRQRRTQTRRYSRRN